VLLLLLPTSDILVTITKTKMIASSLLKLKVVVILFNSFISRTTCVIQHQKGEPFWILMKQEMMGWNWHQLDRMQIALCSRQITMPASHHSDFLQARCSS